MQSRQEIEASGRYVPHHSAFVREYVSRKKGEIVREYAGEFGKGFIVLSPNWDSTRYSFITYYIEV